MPRIPPSQQRQILRGAERAARSLGSRIGGALRRLGPIGGLIQALADAIAGGRGKSQGTSQADIDEAARMLQSHGFEIGRPNEPIAPPIQTPSRTGTQRPPEPPNVPKVEPPRRKRSEPEGPAESVKILPTRVRGAVESITDDIKGFSGWVLTPQSSNLHAVAYDYHEQILYIQYRADGKPIGYKEGISICSGKNYKIGIRADIPGPIYSYGGAGRKVPESLFNTLSNTRSPGKIVWDRLRVCGSQWMHQVPYSLTDIPQGQNVPRKATRRGFRVRNVPTIGQGRRGSRRSTLPESVGRIRQ